MRVHLFVYYPGHLGPRPVTELPGGRGVVWDLTVKCLPDDLVDAVRYLVDECGFYRAYDFEDAAKVFDLSQKDLLTLIDSGVLERHVYKPTREGEPEVPVVVFRGRGKPAKSEPKKAKSEPEKSKKRTGEEESHG